MSKNKNASPDSSKRKRIKMEQDSFLIAKSMDSNMNAWKKLRRNEESPSKYSNRPSTSTFKQSPLQASYAIEYPSRRFPTRPYKQNFFFKRSMAFRPSRDVRNFSISPRRNRYYVSIKRDRDFNKSPEDVQIYGKPRFYPPSYDISPDRSCVKTPEVYDPADLKEMMRKAKENENLDEYYRCRDLLNDLLKSPLEPIGKPKHHKPVYDVSPVRIRCKTPEILDAIELRKLMRDAKENENLDQYYHYRDLLNKLFKDPVYRLKQKTQIVEINNSEEMELEELDCVDELEEKEIYENEATTNRKILNEDLKKNSTKSKADNLDKRKNVSINSDSEGEEEDDVFLQFQEEGLDMDEMTKAADSQLLGKQSIAIDNLILKNEDLYLREIFEGGRFGRHSFFHQIMSQEKKNKNFRKFLLLFTWSFNKSNICKGGLKEEESIISYIQKVLKIKDEFRSPENISAYEKNLKQPLSLSQMSFTKFIEFLYLKA